MTTPTQPTPPGLEIPVPPARPVARGVVKVHDARGPSQPDTTADAPTTT